MSNPTANFGWVMPTATDLVTDLPADFAVFGQGVDTTMAGLKGGTTGQILSKTSNTDMAFTWVSANPGDITGVTAGTGISGGGTSGDVTITNSMATAITTSGDLIQGTGSGTFARLGVGTNGQVLTSNGTSATWAAAGSTATISQIASGSLSGTSVVISSLTQDQLYLRISGALWNTSNAYMTVRINSVSTGLYNNVSTGFYTSGNVYNIWNFDNATASGAINLTTTTQTQDRTNADNNYWLKLTNCKSPGFTNYEFTSNYQSNAAGISNARGDGIFLSAVQVTSIQILNSSGTAFTSGTYTLWGA